MIALRALGALLTYPRPELLAAVPEIRDAVVSSRLVDAERRGHLGKLITELGNTDPLELEQRYVALFDTSRSTCLWLFEHVHGESRDRGQAMVDLKGVYERAGLQLCANELPDYLPAMLEYLSYRELTEARGMLGDCAHILRKIGARLAAQRSHYAAVFDALLVIAAEPGLDLPVAAATEAASSDDKSHVDDDWMDAPAFGPSSPGIGTEPGVTPLRYLPRTGRGEGVLP